MLTVTETKVTQRTFDTPAQIAGYLREEYEARLAAAPFKPGDTAAVIGRAGMPPDLAAGDVVTVVWCDGGLSPFAHVLAGHAAGGAVLVQVQASNLGPYTPA